MFEWFLFTFNYNILQWYNDAIDINGASVPNDLRSRGPSGNGQTGQAMVVPFFAAAAGHLDDP